MRVKEKLCIPITGCESIQTQFFMVSWGSMHNIICEQSGSSSHHATSLEASIGGTYLIHHELPRKGKRAKMLMNFMLGDCVWFALPPLNSQIGRLNALYLQCKGLELCFKSVETVVEAV
jgi:hypothetical protein